MRFNKYDSDYIMVHKEEIMQLNMNLNSHDSELIALYQTIGTYEDELAIFRHSLLGKRLFELEKANQIPPFYITEEEIKQVILAAVYEGRFDLLVSLRYLLVGNDHLEIHFLRSISEPVVFHYIIDHLDYQYFLASKGKIDIDLSDRLVFEYDNGKIEKRNLGEKRFKVVK